MNQEFLEKWWTFEAEMVEKFGKKPNMEAILYLIGVNEYRGRVPKIKFSKEQKQDLMHVGICTLLSRSGYYNFEGFDEEGWPHYTEVEKVDLQTVEAQEQLLKELILEYFEV